MRNNSRGRIKAAARSFKGIRIPLNTRKSSVANDMRSWQEATIEDLGTGKEL